MMNRKLLAIAAVGLLSATMLSAQEPKLEWVTSQDGMGLEIPEVIKASSDGEVFLLNDFASSGKESTFDPDGGINEGFSLTTDYYYYNLSDGTKVSEKTSTGVPDVELTSGNYNMTLYKVKANGHLSWGVHTNVGYFAGGVVAPTSDGGAVVALKMRHSSRAKYKSDILCQLVDAEGAETPVKWDAPDYDTYGGVYQPVLAKVSKDGKVEWAKRVDVSYKTMVVGGSTRKISDNFDLRDMVADAEGNIYLVGTYRTSINFGRNANLSSPRNIEGLGDSQQTCGDLFIVKLDKTGAAQWNVVTKGQVIKYEVPKNIILENGNLYVSGYMKGNDESSVMLGNNTERLTPTAKDCLFYACLSPSDGAVKWVRLLQTVDHPVSQEGGRVKPMCLTVSGSELYLGGSFYGNVTDGNETYLENDHETQNGLRAFILKCDAANGTVQKAVKIDGGLTEVVNVIPKDGKVLAPGYDLYGGSYLYTLNPDLAIESLNTYTLKNSANSATQGGVVVGQTLVSAMNANKTATFPGCSWTLNVINNGASHYRACVFTGHDISTLATGMSEISVSDTCFNVFGGKGVLTIQAATACQVRVYGIDGRMVGTFDVPAGSTTRMLPAGLYVVNGHKAAVY